MQQVSPKGNIGGKGRRGKCVILKRYVAKEIPFDLGTQATPSLVVRSVLALGACSGLGRASLPPTDTAPCCDSCQDRLNTGSAWPAALMLQP